MSELSKRYRVAHCYDSTGWFDSHEDCESFSNDDTIDELNKLNQEIIKLLEENNILKEALRFYCDNNKIRAAKDKYLNHVALEAFYKIETNGTRSSVSKEIKNEK